MISNERSAPFGNRPHGERPHGSTKPPVAEDTLKSSKVQIERKTFVLALKENTRGRFLRISIPAALAYRHGAADLYTPIPYIVPAQLFAAHLARAGEGHRHRRGREGRLQRGPHEFPSAGKRNQFHSVP